MAAERIPLRGFEAEDARFFEACLPVEVLASRGERALAFGPLRPTGLVDPGTGRRPFAVVQLRHEDMPGSAYNLVVRAFVQPAHRRPQGRQARR